MDRRFDNRNKKMFKKDIWFGTNLEAYFFNKFVEICKEKEYIEIGQTNDNGVCNKGEYIESGNNTAGADYKLDFKYHGKKFKNHPLEVKWVPTFGKLSLKLRDLKAYAKEGASILFVYNTKPAKVNLRKPKDYDLQKHIERIELVAHQIKWGIMFNDDVKRIIKEKKDDVKPIPYMGRKLGIILQQEEFGDWFKEEDWS